MDFEQTKTHTIDGDNEKIANELDREAAGSLFHGLSVQSRNQIVNKYDHQWIIKFKYAWSVE